MEGSHARAIQERFGLRLICQCQAELYYAGVDDHFYGCPCGRVYRLERRVTRIMPILVEGPRDER